MFQPFQLAILVPEVVAASFVVSLIVYLWGRGIIPFIMVGRSMRPTMGYVNVGYGVAQKEYAVGDVVGFKRGKRNIMHRIVESDNATFIIKGDSSPERDIIEASSISFKVKRSIRLL